MSSTVKALFVGITYHRFPTNTDLGPIPYIYAKSLLTALLEKGIFEDHECYFLTDNINSVVRKVSYGAPTKGNIMMVLEQMVLNCKRGDVLLFYYCGHGGKDDANPNHFGFLKTLQEESGNKAYNVLYDVELEAILSKLPKEVNFTCIFHASNSGAMFVKSGQEPSAYTGRAIALTSVPPDIPLTMTEPDVMEGRLDFSTFLHDHVVKALDKNPKKWPTYDQVASVIAEHCKQNPRHHEKTLIECQLYHDPNVDTAKYNFLSSIIDQDRV